MLNFGPKRDMEKRPEQEPKFSLKNKSDKFIFLFTIISLVVVAALIVGAILLYYFLPR